MHSRSRVTASFHRSRNSGIEYKLVVTRCRRVFLPRVLYPEGSRAFHPRMSTEFEADYRKRGTILGKRPILSLTRYSSTLRVLDAAKAYYTFQRFDRPRRTKPRYEFTRSSVLLPDHCTITSPWTTRRSSKTISGSFEEKKVSAYEHGRP